MFLGNVIYWIAVIYILVHSFSWNIIRKDGQRILFIGDLSLIVALFMIGCRTFPLNGIH